MDDEIKIKDSAEIKEALNEFEGKVAAEQAQKTGTYRAVKFYGETNVPKVVRLVMKCSGGALSERQAEYILFGFVIIAIGVSLYLFFGKSLPDSEKEIPSMFVPGVDDPNFIP